MKVFSVEADARHAGLLTEGIKKAFSSPIVKEDVDDEAKDTPLSASDATSYRSLAMRAACLSLDRPDLACTVLGGFRGK